MSVRVSPTVPTPTRAESNTELINQSKIVNGMKQFVSKKYTFSLFYPYDWQIIDQPNVNGIEIQKINNQGTGFSITIRILDNSQKLSLFNFAKDQSLSRPNGVIDEPQKIVVNTIEGYKLPYLPDGLLVNIFFDHKDGKILNLFAGGEFDQSSQTVTFYNQVVNSVLHSFTIP